MLGQTLQKLLEHTLCAELEAITESQSQVQSGMTHAESKAENDKDTRAIESSYLARGLASRVTELRSSLATIQAWKLPSPEQQPEKALLGRVVTLLDADSEQQQRVWLAPAGGGISLTHADQAFLVLSPEAPLGKALMGRELEDEFEVKSPSGTRDWVIEAIE